MPDCQMCWNDWPTLSSSPFPAVKGEVLCRNCVRDHKHVIAFTRSKGFALITVDPVTGELPSRPQAGPETPRDKPGPEGSESWADKPEEEPPSPPEKKPIKKP